MLATLMTVGHVLHALLLGSYVVGSAFDPVRSCAVCELLPMLTLLGQQMSG